MRAGGWPGGSEETPRTCDASTSAQVATGSKMSVPTDLVVSFGPLETSRKERKLFETFCPRTSGARTPSKGKAACVEACCSPFLPPSLLALNVAEFLRLRISGTPTSGVRERRFLSELYTRSTGRTLLTSQSGQRNFQSTVIQRRKDSGTKSRGVGSYKLSKRCVRDPRCPAQFKYWLRIPPA